MACARASRSSWAAVADRLLARLQLALLEAASAVIEIRIRLRTIRRGLRAVEETLDWLAEEQRRP